MPATKKKSSRKKPLSHQPLAPSDLYQECDPAHFDFETTAEVEDLTEIMGQDRAIEAIRFGVRMGGDGYNLYVLGRRGSSKHAVVEKFLKQEASTRAVPEDWVYVNNFHDSQKPAALNLPPGRGVEFRDDMARLVDDLKVSIPAAFDSENYRSQLSEIEKEFEKRHQRALQKIQEQAEREGMALMPTPHGFAIAPVRAGHVLDEKKFRSMPEDEQRRTEESIRHLTAELRKHLEQLPQWAKERRERTRELDRRIIMLAVGRLIEEVRQKYEDLSDVVRYLEWIGKDVLDHAQVFQTREEISLPFMQSPQADREQTFARYDVNLLVDNSAAAGAPIVYESNPTYNNLVGRIEHQSHFGTLVTDFRMIRPGAIHRANGGFLIIDAERLLMQPFSWDGLKRMLFAGEIRIESPGQMLSLVSTVSLEPIPIPLDVKVVVIGSRLFYYLLSAYDPDFLELFKVAADFEDRIDRDADNSQLYARLIATLARKENLRPFDSSAVARVIEHSARMVEDAEKLSMHMRSVTDLLRESDYWADVDSHDTVAAADVGKAVDMRVFRLDRVRSEIREEVLRRTILIDTDGSRVGQINGLSVVQVGDFAFGHPSRITATARIGEGEVIDIEREIELGGPIHSKGVMILSAFLGSRYAATLPLSLSASLVFEQTYGGVEGDSASLAELCALLSALSGSPVKQSLAVTGSVNQHGEVQVIGGVNEKIEGFFDVCSDRGLTGGQGVLIPAENVKHLMLRKDVVDAVAAGKFAVFAVANVDQALGLLTGAKAGERGASGKFPTGSVNRLVEDRLAELATIRHEFGEKKPRKKKAGQTGRKDAVA